MVDGKTMGIETRLVLWRKIAKLLKHYWFIVRPTELNTRLISCRRSNLVYRASNLTFMKVFGRPALCEHSRMLVFSRLVSCICSRYDALYRCFTDSLLVISGRFNFPQIYRYGIIDATKHQRQVVDLLALPVEICCLVGWHSLFLLACQVKDFLIACSSTDCEL